MSNIFDEVLKNASAVEEKYLGPSYPYYRNIKTPTEIGMGTQGSLQQTAKNIDGLIQYVQLLVSGNSRASATGGPLGNKFFLQTGAKCAAVDTCTDPTDVSTCEKVDRYIYVDNVPAGNIPFISSGMGVNFSELRGLIPGAMGNLNVLNPFGIMRSFLAGSTPKCQPLTMQTIDVNNAKSSKTYYVTLADIQSMDPCSFPNGVNPLIPGSQCREAFEPLSLPSDPVAQVYFAGLSVLGLYIFYRIMDKAR